MVHPTAEENFHLVYERFRERVYAYTLSVCRMQHLAEEATQEVFMQIWIHRETLAFVENMDKFIFTIAFRKSLNLLRKAAYNTLLLNELQKSSAAPGENEDEKMIEVEYKDLFQQALNHLSPQKRIVFQLSKQNGLNYHEIAEKLNLSPNTIRNHMVEALRIVRAFLRNNQTSMLPISFFLTFF